MIRKEEWKIYNNVFDQFTLRKLFKLSSQHFEQLHGQLSVGKEANVFSAETSDGDFVAVKIWRLDNSNFNKMYNYIIQDPRYEELKNKKRAIIFAWAQREFRNLLKAREVIRVPTPIAIENHIIVLELIGHGDQPSLQLNKQPPENPQDFYKRVIIDMKKLYHQGMVHGDLSPFNILNHDEKPVFIDFSQATLTTSRSSDELLKRDISIINNYFRKLCEVKSDDELLEFIKSDF